MISPVALTLAFFLDLVIGDPRWLPHPVAIIGKGITAIEGFLRKHFREETEKAAGVLLVIVIVPLAGILAFLISKFLLSFSNGFLMFVGTALFVYLVSTTLALRGLIDSARLVIGEVKRGDIVRARQELSMIVGRDTDTLGEEAILRATIETVAENLSDGFVAPLFFFVIGGLPLAMAYKAVNTLDSMVGYKSPRYIRFGWAAARLDDVANYVPARMTGFFITVGAFAYYFVRPDAGRSIAFARAGDSFRVMLRDGRNHTSPNSGVPEAAMAGALGVRLGGPATYGGSIVVKPYIGDGPCPDHREAAESAIAIATVASAFFVAVAVAILIGGAIL